MGDRPARPPDRLTLNCAIVIAEIEGPEADLRIVDQLSLGDFRYLHSTGPNSYDVSGGPTRHVRPFDVQDNSPARPPNGASSNADQRKSLASQARVRSSWVRPLQLRPDLVRGPQCPPW